jgi:hypothetical protein
VVRAPRQATLPRPEIPAPKASRQPFCDSPRELLAMGFDPKSTLVMKPHGSDAISLKGVLGEVAKVSVHEGKQFISPQTFPSTEKGLPSRGLGEQRSKAPEAPVSGQGQRASERATGHEIDAAGRSGLLCVSSKCLLTPSGKQRRFAVIIGDNRT